MSAASKSKLQRFRKFTLIVSMLVFPITIYYFSPYLILMAAMRHIINGSCSVFGLMFVFGLFFGRLWCGFFCPTGGLSECFAEFSPKNPKQGLRNFIKYGIWFVWILTVAICHILGKGDYKIMPFFMTKHGISVSQIGSFIIYYGIVILFLVSAIVHGKRANCHYICWMAPFMIFSYRIGRALHLPQLRIKTKGKNCIECKKCDNACPMSLSVSSMIKMGAIKNSECILCGECYSACNNNVIEFKITNK